MPFFKIEDIKITIVVKIIALEVLADETLGNPPPPLPPHARFKMPLRHTNRSGNNNTSWAATLWSNTSSSSNIINNNNNTTTGKKYSLRDSFRSQTSIVHKVFVVFLKKKKFTRDRFLFLFCFVFFLTWNVMCHIFLYHFFWDYRKTDKQTRK